MSDGELARLRGVSRNMVRVLDRNDRSCFSGSAMTNPTSTRGRMVPQAAATLGRSLQHWARRQRRAENDGDYSYRAFRSWIPDEV